MVLAQIVALNHHVRINMDGGSVNLQGLLMLMKTPTVTSDFRKVFSSSRIPSGEALNPSYLKLSFTFRKEAESGSPYDGVFSFSQGASLGAYLCVLQQMGNLNAEFKYVIKKSTKSKICLGP